MAKASTTIGGIKLMAEGAVVITAAAVSAAAATGSVRLSIKVSADILYSHVNLRQSGTGLVNRCSRFYQATALTKLVMI
jgi:hypothetical protein